MKTRPCDHCGNVYEYRNKNSQYCSDLCRANGNKAKKAAALAGAEMPAPGEQVNMFPSATPAAAEAPKPLPIKPNIPAPYKQPQMPKAMEIEMPSRMDPDSYKFVIGMLQRDRDRWEEQFKNQVEENKKLSNEYVRLQKELDDTKLDVRLKELEKPSGLSGFMQNGGSEIMPYIGPALGELAKAFTSRMTGQQMGGLPQGQAGEMVAEFGRYLATIDDDKQKQLWNLITKLSVLPEDNFSTTIVQLLNIIQNGTPWQQQQQAQPQYGYGYGG